MRLTATFIAEVTGGTLSFSPGNENSPAITSVTTDSRAVQKGALFVCLPGEKVDGHDFATQAVNQGAAALLACRQPFQVWPEHPVAVIVVADVVVALGLLAKAWRRQCRGKVVGVTGTAGKTTVKEVLGQVLGRRGVTCRNRMNLNNQIGLPLSMLEASIDADFWVMEAGISKSGDMDALGAILQPDLAIILNVGVGHLAGLGDKGTAHHKARLLQYVPPEGLILVSADYPDLVREARAIRPDLIFFSTTGRQVKYRAAYVVPAGEDKGLYRLWLDGDSVDVEAPFRGAFGAENVIAIAAAAHLSGLQSDEIAIGLAEATLPKQRFDCHRSGSWLVIDDSYNANPLSASRMLDAAAEMAGDKPLVCVLGEMLELGVAAEEEHEKWGRHVATVKARAVFWKGGHLKDVTSGLERETFSGVFRPVSNLASLLEGLHEAGVDGGVMLFKGSRANKLEELVAAFIRHTEGNHAV